MGLQAGPETIKNGHKNLAQRVECSPAFLTKDGVRAGANTSIRDTTAKVGPGSYATDTGGGPSSNPLVTSGVASAFKDRVPRFVDSTKQQVDSKYQLEWDSKHWNRASAAGKISS